MVSLSGDRPSAGRRAAVAFGRFWWEFLVGDTPELLVGSVVAIAVAALLAHTVGVRAVVVGVLPVLVVVVLTGSTLRARAETRAHSADTHDADDADAHDKVIGSD